MIEFTVDNVEQVFSGELQLKVLAGGEKMAIKVATQINASVEERLRQLFSGELIKQETKQVVDSIDSTDAHMSGDTVSASVLIGGNYLHEAPERSGNYTSSTTVGQVVAMLQFGTRQHVIESAGKGSAIRVVYAESGINFLTRRVNHPGTPAFDWIGILREEMQPIIANVLAQVNAAGMPGWPKGGPSGTLQFSTDFEPSTRGSYFENLESQLSSVKPIASGGHEGDYWRNKVISLGLSTKEAKLGKAGAFKY